MIIFVNFFIVDSYHFCTPVCVNRCLVEICLYRRVLFFSLPQMSDKKRFNIIVRVFVPIA